MKALIVDNIILYKDSLSCDYYSPSIVDNLFFSRYLDVFEEIKVIAKVFPLEKGNKNLIKIDCSRIQIVELPAYHGIKQMLRCLPDIKKAYKNIEVDCFCSILRVVQLESIFAIIFGKLKKPYAVEVVNDAETQFTPWFPVGMVAVCAMRYFVKHAIGVSYITEYALQKKYPCTKQKKPHSKKYFYSNYPTLDLMDEEILLPKVYPSHISELNIVHVANNMNGNAKGHVTLIKILKQMTKFGYNAKVTFIGDGPSKIEYEELIEEYNLEDRVIFLGKIADHKKVLEFMRKADIFVFPSRGEGMGRVNIEAKAVGLPCLASSTGGIVELFDDEYLFDPDDVDGFVTKLCYLFDNPQELSEMSKKNIESITKYAYSNVKKRRMDFYRQLRLYVKGI